MINRAVLVCSNLLIDLRLYCLHYFSLASILSLLFLFSKYTYLSIELAEKIFRKCIHFIFIISKDFTLMRFWEFQGIV